MFTGLVECTGTVTKLEAASSADGENYCVITLECPFAAELSRGDSVCVAGVCLTVVNNDERLASFFAMPETMNRTNLGRLSSGAKVNLERALRVSDRLGGHIVAGHVDATATVVACEAGPRWCVVRVRPPRDLMRLIAEKGSVCVDGVSLTVSRALDDAFEVSLIPETQARTTLGAISPGDSVNLEVDVLARYVDSILAARCTSTASSQLSAHDKHDKAGEEQK